MAFRNYPNLLPILDHKTNVIQDIREISKENLIICYNYESEFYELHNLDKYNVEHIGEMPSTYETTFPIEVTQITDFMTKWLFSKDQARNNVRDNLAFGKQLEKERKANRSHRATKHLFNVFNY